MQKVTFVYIDCDMCVFIPYNYHEDSFHDHANTVKTTRWI